MKENGARPGSSYELNADKVFNIFKCTLFHNLSQSNFFVLILDRKEPLN